MLAGVTNTKYAFRQHLCEIGFLMDQPPQVVRSLPGTGQNNHLPV